MQFEKWLQSRLTAHGFPVGPIDGMIGALTIAAISSFQARHGLNVTAQADAATVQALRASSSALTPLEMASVPDRTVKSSSPITTGGASNAWPRQADVRAFFGGVGERQKTIDIPYEMRLAWSLTTRVRRMTVHERVAPAVLRVLERVATIYSAAEREQIGLDKFGGSLNVRRMRGGTAYSMHSWGIALDFDPERNGLKVNHTRARLAQDDAAPFLDEWEAEGFISLGRARDFDWMHVQAARL